MTDRKIAAMAIIIVAVIGLGVVGVYLNLLYSPQVPPPTEPPGDEPEIIIKEGLAAWAEAIYWQDFMPEIPEEGPPFMTVIWVNVTNNGNTTVNYFDALRVTIYFHNSSMLLGTLDLMSNIQYFVWPEIKPGESAIFEFTNFRDPIFSPTIEEGAFLYSRVFARWESVDEMILTTPPSALLYTH